MGVDKIRAVNHEWRIPEMVLFAESFLGGSWGVLLGGFVFHHKTSKPEFLLVVFVCFVAWALVLQRLGFLRCLNGAL